MNKTIRRMNRFISIHQVLVRNPYPNVLRASKFYTQLDT